MMIENITQEFLSLIKLPRADALHFRWLLVIPRFINNHDMSYQFPTGLAMVSSALKASGRSVDTLNLNYKKDYLDLLAKTIIDNEIDIVASGGLSGHYSALSNIFDTVKRVNKNIITVCGGGIITADPSVAMEALESADYGLIGEGEILINNFAYTLETGEDVSKVPGVAVKDGCYCPATSEIMNLDCLPFPDYEGFEFDLLMRKGLHSSTGLDTLTTNVVLSRSCPYNCTFCFHTSGSKYRRRSLASVFNELDWLINKYGLSCFTFSDELFIRDNKFIEAFCSRIKEYNIIW